MTCPAVPAKTPVGSCSRLGSGQTLTRAFVYSTTEPIVVDYASETAVALILGQVQQGTDLCGFSTGEIRSLVNCIRTLPGDATGANVFETNHNALLLAGNALQAAGPCFGKPTPAATVTPTPTKSPTTMGPCASVPCGGTCEACLPRCTPGTVCPSVTVSFVRSSRHLHRLLHYRG